MFLTCYFDLAWRWPLINVSKVLLKGHPMTWYHHYIDHLSHCVSPQPGIKPELTVCQASMLPIRPLGDLLCKNPYVSFANLYKTCSTTPGSQTHHRSGKDWCWYTLDTCKSHLPLPMCSYLYPGKMCLTIMKINSIACDLIEWLPVQSSNSVMF